MRNTVSIRRLRPAYTPEELHTVYAKQYDHTRWEDHIQRVNATLDCIHAWTAPSARRIVADLSCGDAAIARNIEGTRLVILGDYVHNDEYAFTGAIERTIDLIGYVDLFVLSETLEHIDKPHELLVKIRNHASQLILSTPRDEQDANNPEHYWGWDEHGVLDLLEQAGWAPSNHTLFTPTGPSAYYTYQIWGATHA